MAKQYNALVFLINTGDFVGHINRFESVSTRLIGFVII